jgi:hypothetical protein
MRIQAVLSPLLIVRHLREGGSAATLNRLGTSRHVADLRLIFSVTLYSFIAASVGAIVFEYWSTLSHHWEPHGFLSWLGLFGDSIAASGTFIAAAFALCANVPSRRWPPGQISDGC